MSTSDDERAHRWHRRAGVARGVRVLVFLLPVVASVGAAAALARALPPATGWAERALHWLTLAVVSTAMLLLIDRIARRLLPLATLLDLTMLFPDAAPSRLRLARQAIRARPIEEQLARVRAAGADPGAVAREILALVAALSAHDRPTRGHAERVRMFTDLLAEQLRLPIRDRDLLRWAALLHDVGKLRISRGLLNKAGKPSGEEWAQLQAHPQHGADLAAALLPWLGEWGDVIVEHHERYDGTGYPRGLSGDRISLGARIVSVADAYDVMTSVRAYRRPVSRAAALRELVRYSGTQFDPVVVRAMVDAGAPRLRRAQGVVAWLSDVPLVANGAVPAATVARVVGAGALATGTVAGSVGTADAVDLPRQRSSVVAAAQDGGGSRAGSPGVRPDRHRPASTDAATTPPVTLPTPAAASDGQIIGGGAEPTGDATPPRPRTAEEDAAGAPPPNSPVSETSGSSGSGSSGSNSGSGSDSSGPSDSAVSGSGGSAGSGSSGAGSGSGGSGGSGPSPSASSSAPLDELTDTVDGAVGSVTETVGGVVGPLISPSPSPSPSPTSGGLLGGLLGR